ncbi:outer membrane lipoprotein carrier protein LolA [Jannaschia sp. LMIT008]|uniref:LolA family protein n=1 Tax=Jannaschia maritima TaxID=3032585 RepID=UPI002810CF16|nr:outer membrane lipoprotein carrier protein LolA [Jannaschia sp. LMIT008]
MRRLLPALMMALTALPAQAEISVSAISRYLNDLSAVRAEFTQINADGSISTGDLAIHRPGRARFDYDPPNAGLVVAGGGQVAVFDPVSNTAPEQYPLSQTPLNLILQSNVNLGRSGTVTRHSGDATQTAIRLQDPANPQYGSIELVFTPNPVTLRQWIITDDSGQQTTVVLGDMAVGSTLGSGAFSIPAEMQRRGLRD